MADTDIVKAVIYPGIGVARIGNAPEGYVVGPEVTEPEPLRGDTGTNPYRDRQGRLYPQAARFRIYGVNRAGDIVAELTAPGSDAKVEWTVHLANKKSAWYSFQLALDIPQAAAANPTTLRNPTVSDRKHLVLDAGAHSLTIPGREKQQKMVAGRFMQQGEPVYLGKMSVEDDARLLVTGGIGKSASYDGSIAITFGNNEAWHDDISDGPVTAKVKLGGRELPVTPSWVIVAPPNYGPQFKSVRTMWDLMRDLAIQQKWLPQPVLPSFTDDIYPIFERMTQLQWVNAGFAGGFGWKSPYDFTTPEWIDRLRDGSLANQGVRRALMHAFRHPDVDPTAINAWPWLYGDGVTLNPPFNQNGFVSLTQTQLGFLGQWVDGAFFDDWDTAPRYRNINAVPLAQQSDMLNRAAMEFCLADAFHPGCEMTWPVRTATMYLEPFRFQHAPPGWVEPGYGEILTYNNASGEKGLFSGQVPGGITRWMAVPWQADTASCRSGYNSAYDPNLPTFWPARVPNQVLSREDYQTVMNAEAPIQDRLTAFARRQLWIDPLGDPTKQVDNINRMIRGFDHLGVVEVFPGPADLGGRAAFPPVIQVEDQHVPVTDTSTAAHPVPRASTTPTVQRFSPEELASIDKLNLIRHPA
ncbi:MAG: LodA/GoxA family CTQ-dependent oxidase [Rhodopila sp.]